MRNKIYEKQIFTEIVKKSNNLTDVAKNLGLSSFCGNRNTIKKYINLYNIDISHFRTMYENRIRSKKDLNEILVSGSTFNSTNLKIRLYTEGLKERKCELCGQNEIWQGKKMSLILDHINGIHDDNRIENLQIVCPNCDATLSTFSGKNTSRFKDILIKETVINYCKCGKEIYKDSTICEECNKKINRKVERPEYEILKNEIEKLGYSATGRKYGVSDNAIRKWIKFYDKHE